MSKNKKLTQKIFIYLLAGSSVLYSIPMAHAATSVIANNTLPSGFEAVVGGAGMTTQSGNIMDITQSVQNAVNKWQSFDVGGSATVNFTGPQNFNSLNYVNGGNLSQIYGTINANGGNIFLVNPAGVQIGNSAQINVGSLYVSNKKLNEGALEKISTDTDIIKTINQGTFGNGELMSLGNINATNVTFEGNGRIVIDADRIRNAEGTAVNNKFKVHTTNADNVVIGYEAYDGTYAGKGKEFNNVYVGDTATNVKGYMWVEDVDQLQAMNTNLSGNYALRNSIDATEKNNFAAVGTAADAFTGKLDGLDNNIFSLSVKGQDNVGLFGVTNDAEIRNVTLIGGSITGTDNVGALVGSANNTVIENVRSTADVTGTGTNTGGIVGSADSSKLIGLINAGTITGNSNAGGIVGSVTGSTITGETYNLGAVKGTDANVGGIAGLAENATIGNDNSNDADAFTMYNRLDVTGAYNVGGIVGSMTATTVQNVENSGDILAKGSTTEVYSYHTSAPSTGSLPAGTSLDTNTSIATVANVNVANAGGIAGTASSSTINNTKNTGNVSSHKDTNNDYYDAGNVGGIVGRAENTNITNAINKENEIRGAHNVGGIAGYFGNTSNANESYIIEQGQNNGGDVMATGARSNNAFVQERIRTDSAGSNESFNVGNMGGVVGYMYGDNTYVVNSSNRGTVHSLDITTSIIPQASKAANTGGVVGKLDRSATKYLEAILGNNSTNAAVSGSYNTGDVRGYTGVGGVVGMMYNGEVTRSYNVGNIKSTRSNSTGTEPLNLGGVVGDTTEASDARALIYDVYNVGQIGDETYTTYGRHVGGVVGRLSGDLIKAYNTGNIYNAYNVNGGVVGYWFKGDIQDVFNTGNITINGKNTISSGWQTGGIIGAFYGAGYVADQYGDVEHNLTNAYNLGSIRVIKKSDTSSALIGGILGGVSSGSARKLTIKNVYTTGEIYANFTGNIDVITPVSSNADTSVTNAVYITPATDEFNNLNSNTITNNYLAYVINYADRNNTSSWTYFITNSKTNTSSTSDFWRVYGGTTPILNAFTPNAKDYIDKNIATPGSGKVQYGTAYNPLLTIVNGNVDSITIDWGAAGFTGMAGLVVNNSDLEITNVNSSGNVLFGGTIYTNGDLTINTAKDGNIALGSASKIYASSVTINADGDFTAYGAITATGAAGDAKITINANTVENYGVITTTDSGGNVTAAGVADSATNITYNAADITNVYKDLPTVGDQYAVTTTSKASNTDVAFIGTNDVNLYYGNAEKGYINAAGDLTATSSNGDVFVDSDLNVGGNLKLTAKGEALLSLTNIGQVQAQDFVSDVAQAIKGLDRTGTDVEANIKAALTDVFVAYGITSDNDQDAIVNYIYQDIQSGLIVPTDTLQDEAAIRYLHNFMNSFNSAAKSIILNSAANKITVDMWDKANAFDLDKYDITGGNTFAEALNNMYVNGNQNSAKNITYIEISNAEQLAGIQEYKNNNTGSGILGYNFALMNDIDASKIEGYQAIGSDVTAYTGTFDGRDNRIIGLNVTGDNAGIFDTIGTDGIVTNLRVYSSNFTGTTNAGAIAGVNNGRIENITTIGNEVTVTDDDGSHASHIAGGIVGTNDENGIIDNVESTGSVIANATGAVVGGLVGTNEGGINNSFSDSAVTVASGATAAHLGGAVGYNTGDIRLVDSLGVTNGGASDNVGGIIGTNEGNMYSGYNESIVSGHDNVGGIIGTNSGTVNNIVNATAVTGEDITGTTTDASEYVGGLIGANSGTVTNGRNNGTITGTEYVGGMVGSNAKDSTLTNLVNDSSADITGEKYVGGIAGSNAGTITADEENDNLINRGSITGNQYVGGVAGENTATGKITNTINSVVLNAIGQDAMYFGGVVGENSGIIDGATNTSDIDITAVNGTLVGGIIGHNTQSGTLQGEILNQGSVTGTKNVGGIIGKNENDKVLQGTSDKRLTVTNEGNVTAENGGAAGIIYINNGDIMYADITNSGIVSGGDQNDSITGGLFGTNSGNITNSTLTNRGIVTGGGTVGGLIGKNTGNISTSSLKNEAGATVIGVNNVGGLIGQNTGTITGGRDDKDSYYKYQIYNNGVINVGTWTDTNNDGVVDAGEITSDNGSNIGGLIGSNGADGSLTAGYNTGAINAVGSTNVGGIIGNNAGTADQVFNTVFNSDGTNGAVTGGTNVGGIVGDNSGTLTNAYNTTAVSGTADSTGNIAGNNAGTVANVYGNNTLIGQGKNAANSYVVDTSDDWNHENKYTGFDFSNTWKIYEGYGHPLLKVFLTSAKYDPTAGTSFVYNGQEQGLDISKVTAADNLAAYTKVNQLLQALQNKNAGNDYLGFVSEQIAASTDGGFNPNNLGYDIDVDYDITKADLTVSLSTVNRTYGNSALTNGTAYSVTFEGLKGNDTYDSSDYTLTDIDDGAVASISGDKQTNDAGTYNWSATVTLTDSDLANNYNITGLNGTSGTVSGTDNSIVNKAKLDIHSDDKTVAIGQIPNYTGTDINGVLVNGDSLASGTYSYGIQDSSNINVDGQYPIGIYLNGTYYELGDNWENSVSFFKNYDITFTPGTLTVSANLLPANPPDRNPWDYLYKDNPFDRIRNFRERKAEINFVDGGMEI